MILERQSDNLTLAAAFLAARGARFVVIGGCALRLHGYRHVPADLDVVPEPSAANVRALFEALCELGTVGRARPPSDRAVATRDIVTHTSPIGSVDVLLARGREEHATLEARASSITVPGRSVPVASLDDVLRLRARFGKAPVDA